MGILPSLPHRLVVLALTVSATAGFFPATVDLVHRGPGAPLSFILRHASRLVTFLYVLGLPFLFVGVFALVSAWHFFLLSDCIRVVQMLYRRLTVVAG
jgi:hypothetical protein